MINNISLGKLKEWVESNQPVTVLDVRDAETFQQEHIKGAQCLPMNRLEEAKARFKSNQSLVVYCSDYQSNSSLYAARKLKELGFNKVYAFGGGLAEWKKKGLPVESRTAK